MDIVIISQYLRDIENLNTNNSRFIYLAKMLSQNIENKIEIITSDFMHGPKCHAKSVEKCEEYDITAIHEPGYKKNICLTRFYSHYVLAKNIKKYLSNRKKPDCVYCAIPSLDVAYAASKYCKKNGIRFIVDIQDLWPEAFKMVFDFPIISNLLLAPMKWQANAIYSEANEIIAVSETYVKRAMKVNRKSKFATSVFLGTEKEKFDQYKSGMKYSDIDNNIWLVYIGTLGHSYDLRCVFDALNLLKQKGIKNLKFLVMGDGPLEEMFKTYAENLKLDVKFTGNLSYPEMVKNLTKCDIAVNPIVHGAAGSIINKVGDYAMAGLPVANTQECLEYKELLLKYKAGINCENSNAKALADSILLLVNDKEKRLYYGENSRRMGEEKFDRAHTYKEIVDIILWRKE